MRFLLRKTSSSVRHASGSGLTLLLLFVVLVPSIGLLWFLNQAVQNEQLVVRQKLIDAYRAQLAGVQERLESGWRSQADELAAQADAVPPSAMFARVVRAAAADAVVCFDAAGGVLYPDAPGAAELWRPTTAWSTAHDLESSDPAAAARAYAHLVAAATDATSAARALQAQARCLVRAGDTPAAITVLTGELQAERFRDARDAQGRLLAPNADLMALELLRDTDPAAAQVVRERLQARVLDYEHGTMPAAQRRFLLREMQRLPVAGRGEAGPRTTAGPVPPPGAGAPGEVTRQPVTSSPPNPSSASAAVAQFVAGENLAAAYVESREHPAREPALRLSALPGVWQHASTDGRVLLLHHSDALPGRLHAMIAPSGLPADVRLDFIEPGHEADSALLSLPAGAILPGWRLAITMKDPGLFAAATSERISAYVWIVALVVFSVVVLGLLALGLVRRQIALTQLRNDLVANVTHELKTPLASMRLLVETLLNTPQLNEGTTRDYLQLIATENLRLSRLIGNFLTFSRIERNKYTFDFKRVAAHAIVHSAVTAVKDRFQTPGVTFNVAVAPDLPSVTADADALVTALVNLLDNAWKYSGDTKQIALTANAQNGHVRFAVRDNGVGLAPREQKRVFQRFYQVRPSHSTGGGGSGLGLSIVQFIVAAHRGTVAVESEPGRGSTFSITLPAASAGSQAGNSS